MVAKRPHDGGIIEPKVRKDVEFAAKLFGLGEGVSLTIGLRSDLENQSCGGTLDGLYPIRMFPF